jgi:hypothetical protein
LVCDTERPTKTIDDIELTVKEIFKGSSKERR